MLTNIYVDGFNLYYGALRGTNYKWLNPRLLCEKLLPAHKIGTLKYFTAKISARPDDPGAPTRQQIYLRALATLPDTELVYGHFLQRSVRMLRASPGHDGERFVEVIKTEEKGSDVNLASAVLRDAYTETAEAFVIVSNDNDLHAPVDILTRELGRIVGILNPNRRRRPAHKLGQAASFVKPIRAGALAASQLPDTLRDAVGQITKPSGW